MQIAIEEGKGRSWQWIPTSTQTDPEKVEQLSVNGSHWRSAESPPAAYREALMRGVGWGGGGYTPYMRVSLKPALDVFISYE